MEAEPGAGAGAPATRARFMRRKGSGPPADRGTPQETLVSPISVGVTGVHHVTDVELLDRPVVPGDDQSSVVVDAGADRRGRSVGQVDPDVAAERGQAEAVAPASPAQRSNAERLPHTWRRRCPCRGGPRRRAPSRR